MPFLPSRRALLEASFAAGAVPVFSRLAWAGPARRLTAGTRTLDVDGKAARVFRLSGPDGEPGLTLEPGERFHVDLVNDTGTEAIVHWHGQIPHWTQDGFPWPQTPPLEAGATKTYDFAPLAGTYWMHSHEGLQEQRLLTAPLIVRGAEAREDRQDVVIMLHDFSFRASDEILAGLTNKDAPAEHMIARETENAPAPRAGHASEMMPGMMMGSNTSTMGSTAKGAMSMDLNDVAYDAFLANDRTLSDPEVVQTEAGGRVRLRIINAASSSAFWIDLGGLTGTVVAVDGHSVHPVAGQHFPIAIAQRLDILVDLPRSGAYPVLARLEGTSRQTGVILAAAGSNVARITATSGPKAPPVDNSLEVRLGATTPLPRRTADLRRTLVLDGGMKPYAWSIDGAYWPNIAPLMVRKGQRVELEFRNKTMMAHPMHLHGHTFQVVAVNGQAIQGAMRDTVQVMPMESVRIAFDADNPGRWALHCHNLYHMAGGMMTEVRYDGIAV